MLKYHNGDFEFLCQLQILVLLLRAVNDFSSGIMMASAHGNDNSTKELKGFLFFF